MGQVMNKCKMCNSSLEVSSAKSLSDEVQRELTISDPSDEVAQAAISGSVMKNNQIIVVSDADSENFGGE